METFTQKLEAEIRAKINPAYADIRGDESWERKVLLDEIDRLRLISKEYYFACDEAARTASRYRRALAEAQICLKEITELLENTEESPKA